MDVEIEVPPFFICPISLEIMKDPVTLSTGITYDRDSIEKWVFVQKNYTCPVTKQALSAMESTEIIVTPNHTLRRFIQSWCTINASSGVERFPTPRTPVTKIQILKLLKDSQSPQLQMRSLKRLRAIAMESETNKRTMESAGAAEFLSSFLTNIYHSEQDAQLQVDDQQMTSTSSSTTGDEALSVLYHMQLSQAGLKSLFGKNGEFVELALTPIMQSANYESRTYAILLLKEMFQVADPMQVIPLKTQFFIELVQVIRDQVSRKASKATLKLLASICPWGKNRIKAVEAGAVSVLIDTLLDSSDKRVCEMALVLIEQMCQCAEGRAELLKHGAGLAVVSKKIFRVSQTASERAVKILYSVAKYSGNSGSVVQEMLQLGVVGKLCLVLQVDCGSKTKDRAREILKLHARAWKNSPCIPMNLLYSYPS